MGRRVRGQEGGAEGGEQKTSLIRKTLQDAGGQHKNRGQQVEPNRF